MLGALGAMPVKLKNYGGEGYSLPWSAPSGASIQALARRDLVIFIEAEHCWKRTPLGESVWAAR
jgi:hypothetical protein